MIWRTVQCSTRLMASPGGVSARTGTGALTIGKAHPPPHVLPNWKVNCIVLFCFLSSVLMQKRCAQENLIVRLLKYMERMFSINNGFQIGEVNDEVRSYGLRIWK